MSLRADWVRKAHGSTLCGGISAEAVIDRAGVYPGRERPLSVPPMRANDPQEPFAVTLIDRRLPSVERPFPMPRMRPFACLPSRFYVVGRFAS